MDFLAVMRAAVRREAALPAATVAATGSDQNPYPSAYESGCFPLPEGLPSVGGLHQFLLQRLRLVRPGKSPAPESFPSAASTAAPGRVYCLPGQFHGAVRSAPGVATAPLV